MRVSVVCLRLLLGWVVWCHVCCFTGCLLLWFGLRFGLAGLWLRMLVDDLLIDLVCWLWFSGWIVVVVVFRVDLRVIAWWVGFPASSRFVWGW